MHVNSVRDSKPKANKKSKLQLFLENSDLEILKDKSTKRHEETIQ